VDIRIPNPAESVPKTSRANIGISGVCKGRPLKLMITANNRTAQLLGGSWRRLELAKRAGAGGRIGYP